MILRLTLILFCLVSCSTSNESESKHASEIQSEAIESKENYFRLVSLNDTTLNGVMLKFTELSNQEFSEMEHRVRETNLLLQPGSEFVTRLDSCLLIKIYNGEIDSLCNKVDGNNIIGFKFLGFWEEHSLALINYSDWEGGNDFFISLKNGSYYNLAPNYKVSPDRKHILSYVDLDNSALIPSELMLTGLSNGEISTRFSIGLNELIVTKLGWLNGNECLLTVGRLNEMDFTVVDLKNFKLTFAL